MSAPPDPDGTALGSGPAEASASSSVTRNSAVMAAGSIVSRLTGFLRTAAIGAAIGAAAVADDYNLAITLPNMVFELLVGGVLSSVIVPSLVRSQKLDADRGQAYAQRLLTLAVLGLGTATALAVASAPLFTWALARDAGAADRDLITRLAYLILPALFCYGMAALCGAILNSRGHFAAPMWTPILNNLVVIATGVTFLVISTRRPEPDTITTTQLLVLGLGTLCGVLVQAVGLWPALRRVGFRWRWRFDFHALGLAELGRLAAWMLLFVVVNQISLFVVLNIAKRAGVASGAGVTVFQYSFLIFMMAHGIVAVSVLTALMPRLSAAAAEGRHADLVAQLNNGMRLVAVVLVPITAAYLVLGRPIAVTLFQWGRYSHHDALATGRVIAVAGLCLLPYAVMQLQQFAFYALRDTRTPALLNVPVAAIRSAAALIFYLALPASAVAAALMGGSALSFVVGGLLGLTYLRRHVGLLGLRRVAVTMVKLGVAAAAAAVPTLLVGYGVTRAMGDGKLASAVHLALGGAVLGGGYVAVALLLRIPDVRDLVLMVRSRFAR